MFWVGFVSGAATMGIISGIVGWILAKRVQTLFRLMYRNSNKSNKL